MRRARQRTFEAAYWRTCLGQFSFALIVLKIFQKEFYAVGGNVLSAWKGWQSVLYTVFGCLMILVAALRRSRSNVDFFVDGHGRYFRTSGRVVLITSLLALALYINLIFLLLLGWTISSQKYHRILETDRGFKSQFLSGLYISNIEYPHHIHAHPHLSLTLKLLPIIQSVCILVKHHIAFVTNILTHAATPPCCKENIGIIILIMTPHHLANCLGSFPTIIKWNPRAKVMSNMSLQKLTDNKTRDTPQWCHGRDVAQ